MLSFSVYLRGIVVSVWPAHRPSGGDGAGLTVAVRGPESGLFQSAGHTNTWASLCPAVLILSTNLTLYTTTQPCSMWSAWISLSLNSRHRNYTDIQTSFVITARKTGKHIPSQGWPHVCLNKQGRVSGDAFKSHFKCLPVLQLLAVDAYSSLVALGDTHLVSAALNLLTGVLGCVYIWENTGN